MVITNTIQYLSRLKAIVELYDDLTGDLERLKMFDVTGQVDPNDLEGFKAAIVHKDNQLSKVDDVAQHTFGGSIEQLRERLVKISALLENHHNYMSELAKFEGAYSILAEANQFSDEGEGSRVYYNEMLSSLRRRIEQSAAMLKRNLV